jgi:hypothetical protein
VNWLKEKHTNTLHDEWRESYTYETDGKFDIKTKIEIKKNKDAYLTMYKGKKFVIRTSQNLYNFLYHYPMQENEMMRFNDLGTDSYERAIEIAENIISYVENCRNLNEVVMYVKSEDFKKFQNGEEVMGYFYSKECYTEEVTLEEREILRGFLTSDCASIKKNGWTKKEEDNYFDNF